MSKANFEKTLLNVKSELRENPLECQELTSRKPAWMSKANFEKNAYAGNEVNGPLAATFCRRTKARARTTLYPCRRAEFTHGVLNYNV
jgi:hypothetical protein